MADIGLEVVTVPTSALIPSEYNPRKWDDSAMESLKESIRRYGMVDPLLANRAPGRMNIVIGGHFRLAAAKQLGIADVPVIYLDIPDLAREKELNLRLNKNLGAWDLDLLAEFDESILADIGFGSEELDDVFGSEDEPEKFDLEKELRKLDIKKVEIVAGDVFELGGHRLMCGDSTSEADMPKLMGGEKCDMCMTDPPYILDYLKGKKKSKKNEGFGYKRDRHYIGTDELPPDFTEKWMGNVAKAAKDDFSIIVYENWKNIRTIWGEMEKHWKVRNMIVWHLPNRVQGFAGQHKLFNKHDIAIVGSSETAPPPNLRDEDAPLQNEYETALFAINGKPHWEKYGKGKKLCPTDFIEFRSEDEKHSGQGIIFGTKPTQILIPYIKILTKRDDLVVEPFGGSGSTLIACEKMGRRCRIMEKCPTYAEVIKRRWEKATGKKAVKISEPPRS